VDVSPGSWPRTCGGSDSSNTKFGGFYPDFALEKPRKIRTTSRIPIVFLGRLT
jgi:hypothetical protein